MPECPRCQKAGEIIEEKRVKNVLIRKFQCGHVDPRVDYFAAIEEILQIARKGDPCFRSIENYLRNLDRLIRKLERTAESTVDFAKEAQEELHKLRDAKMPQRKAIARGLAMLQEDWEIVLDGDRRTVDFIRGQFQKAGDLRAEHFGELERLEKKYLKKRRGVSPDIILMRRKAVGRTK